MQDKERWQNTLNTIKKRGKKKKIIRKAIATGMTFLVLSLGITGTIQWEKHKTLEKQKMLLEKDAEFQVDLVLNQGIYYDQDYDLIY